jgi:hypothetical protein
MHLYCAGAILGGDPVSGCARRHVSRSRSPVVAKRNDEIFAAWRRGATLTDLAARHGIARQVVGRIIASYHPELEEDTDRALYRGELWRLYDQMGEVFDQPGWKMAPNGHVGVGPDGEPAVDVNAKIQAGELRLKVMDAMRKLDGRDRQQPRQVMVAVSVAEEQMRASLEAEAGRVAAARADLAAAAAARPGVVPGEVVRELPPGQ